MRASVRYGMALAEQVLPHYPLSHFQDPFWADAQVIGDAVVRACVGGFCSITGRGGV